MMAALSDQHLGQCRRSATGCMHWQMDVSPCARTISTQSPATGVSIAATHCARSLRTRPLVQRVVAPAASTRCACLAPDDR